MKSPNAGEDAEGPDSSNIDGGNVWRKVWQFCVCFFKKKLQMKLSCNPETSLLVIYPKEMKTCVHIETCM